MQIISSTNIEQIKKQIKASKEKPIVVEGADYEFNRKMLEYGKFDILLSPEKRGGKISLKKFDSGLNHISAKEAAKNSVAIGINPEELRKLNKKEKARRLFSIIRNIKFCRKAKAKIKILNYKDKKDALAFLISLGADTKQAKEATE